MPENVERGYTGKHRRLASKPTPPSRTLSSSDVVQPPQTCQQVDWATRAQSIAAWISTIPSYSESAGSSTGNTTQASDTMSDSSRLRNKKTQIRSRSCSPNKKSSQYRNTVLKPTKIFVDVVHTLPPDIEALLPSGLRNLLDLPHSLPTSVTTNTEDSEKSAWTRELAENVRQLAAVYRDECRELAGKPGSEPEYRTHLYGDVVEKLARFSPWRRTLMANCSDKSWLTGLKPPALTPILSLPWPSLAARPQENMLQEFTPASLNSNIMRVVPSSEPSNLASPPTCTEASESSVSNLDNTITTPKPDITVGISREAFSDDHANLLEYWQASNLVFSDPHATQGDMRCPFLIIEAKGLVTHGNLIGAQNQAAGGGACAIRLLASLAAQDPKVDAPRIVFSCTTEGAIHELWIHFQMADENHSKQHMACLGAWRTTLDRHANEFVAALALIFSWGVDVFYPQIKQVLDRVLDANRVAS